VVTFASVHFQLNWHNFAEALQGGSVVEGKVIADWTKTDVFKRWTKDRYAVDLYIWLQVNNQTMEPYQASFFTNDRSPHRCVADALVSSLKSAPLSDMDNNYLLV
jgi:hypothetical protein